MNRCKNCGAKFGEPHSVECPRYEDLRPANRALDAAVKAQHEWDDYQIDRILDFMVNLPRRGEARRFVENIFDKVREQAATCPELALEVNHRRKLAAQDGPAAA